MRIELLGTGGYHPSELRHTACVLLPKLGLMLDAGTAAFRVHGRNLDSSRLDVVLTHGHLDHIIGLTYLLGLERDGQPVETVVHAREVTIQAVRDRLLAKELFPIQPVARFDVLGETATLGDARVTTFPLDHPGGSIGVRIDEGGKSLAYVTDTRRLTAETISKISSVDLLLHEAHFDGANADMANQTGHCTSRDAAWAANEAGVGRLLMMHANPRADEALLSHAVNEARELRPEAAYATDNMVVEI